jgi:hypothetical protein
MQSKAGDYTSAVKTYLCAIEYGEATSEAFRVARIRSTFQEIEPLVARAEARSVVSAHRDALEQKVRNMGASSEDLQNIVQLNIVLGEQTRSVLLYADLVTSQPSSLEVRHMYRDIQGVLLHQRRYDLIAQHGPSSAIEARGLLEMVGATKRAAVWDLLASAEALAGLGRDVQFREVVKSLRAIDPSSETCAEIEKRCLRAGRPDLAKDVCSESSGTG